MLVGRSWRRCSGRFWAWVLIFGTGCAGLWVSRTGSTPSEPPPLRGEFLARTLLRNPYAHIPAHCYVETTGGLQNSCQFCHTDAVFLAGLGNNMPQGGASDLVGNLQLEYAFPALQFPFASNGSTNPWENTLFPERLAAAVRELGQSPKTWKMREWIDGDNWPKAHRKRPGTGQGWDSGFEHPFRFFPALDPADLPADADGFVRSASPAHGRFRDESGWVTGWRAINFVPYGMTMPHAGSVGGVYLRLPERFQRDLEGEFDRAIYEKNLDLLVRAIQGRLEEADPQTYWGTASGDRVRQGLYPVGTEFVHPVHYVDVEADGREEARSPFPGLRSRRVKEIRWMVKRREFEPNYGGPATRDEDAPLYVGVGRGWIDNGAGWLLAGFIEDAEGELRPQTANELAQCVGCHSGGAPRPRMGPGVFTSGTGSTVDSTWALIRKLPRDLGWGEMDVLGYRRETDGKDSAPGSSRRRDPFNPGEGKGEFHHLLESLVGVSFFGVTPNRVERFLTERIRRDRDYPSDWPSLDSSTPEKFAKSQRLRKLLLGELAKRGDHLDDSGGLAEPLLYPTEWESLAAARRYRQVVVTQRYDLGKEVFSETPINLRYFRSMGRGFSHQDGKPYRLGEPIVDRPVDLDARSFTYGAGVVPTLIEDRGRGADGSRTPDPLTISGNSDYSPRVTFPGSEER